MYNSYAIIMYEYFIYKYRFFIVLLYIAHVVQIAHTIICILLYVMFTTIGYDNMVNDDCSKNLLVNKFLYVP